MSDASQPRRYWRVPVEMGGWTAEELFYAHPTSGGYITLRAPGGYKILMDPKDLRSVETDETETRRGDTAVGSEGNEKL